MPRKNQSAQQPHELDVAEFFTAIDLIEQERGIPKGYMMEKITLALVSAYKKDHPEAGENVIVDMDQEKGTVRMYLKKDVVETVDDPATEISVEEAQAKLPTAMLGDVISVEI